MTSVPSRPARLNGNDVFQFSDIAFKAFSLQRQRRF
jgi:hypothetical protein